MEKELNQEGDAKEQPKEDISKDASEVTSPEEKETSEKQKEDEWKRLMQSRTDKAESTAQKLETELQKLRSEREQQRLVARRKEIADLEGDTDEQAKVKRKHELEDEVNKLQELKEKEEGAVQRKYDQAIELARQHSLSLDDARDLMNAGTPKEMELLAQLKVAEKAKVQSPPKEKEGFEKPDSGTSDAGNESDEAFMKSYSEGASSDHARAQKILTKIK